MKSNRYFDFCYWFSQYLKIKRDGRLYQKQDLMLEKANFTIGYEEFQAIKIVTTILCFLFSFFSILAFFYLLYGSFPLVLLILVPLFIGVSVFVSFFFLPTLIIDQRGRNIDRYLPFAVNYINTMAKTNISPVELFRSLAATETYGVLREESIKIVKEVELMGIDNLTALKHAIERSPSKKFKGFLQGLIGTIQSGSSLTSYLSHMVDFYMQDDLRNREKKLESLSMIAEMFVVGVIAFPIFLIIIVTVFGFIGNSSAAPYEVLFLLSFIILPIAYIGFYYLIKTTTNDDFKLSKKNLVDRSFSHFYNANKQLVHVISGSVIVLMVFLIGCFICFRYDFIGYQPYYLYDIFFISFLILIGPYGVFCYLQMKKNKEIQNRFPDLLIDMGNTLSSGMSVFDSLEVASKGNYGKLSPEVKKMKIDLSWNFSLKQIFLQLARRMKNAIINRSIITINQGIYMGGDDAGIFKALANEIQQINQIEEQRNAHMTMYMTIIFLSFFVFLFIIVILNNTLFSYFFEFQQSQTSQLSGFITPVAQTQLHYSLFCFTFVQSIGAGLLGGFLKDGALSAGLRYSFTLGLLSIILFQIIL